MPLMCAALSPSSGRDPESSRTSHPDASHEVARHGADDEAANEVGRSPPPSEGGVEDDCDCEVAYEADTGPLPHAISHGGGSLFKVEDSVRHRAVY